MRPIGIALVSQEYPPETGFGGIGTYTRVVGRALADAGHRVHVIALTAGRPCVGRDGAITLHRLPAPRLGGLVRGRTMSLAARRLAVALYLRRLAAAGRIEVVEGAEWFAETAAFARLKPRRVPLVVRLHTPLALIAEIYGRPLDRAGRRLARLEARLARRADRVTAPSRAVVERVAPLFGLEPSRVEVVPNPIDTQAFSPGSAPDTHEPLVLYVGRIEWQKVGALEPVIPRVLARMPRARFLLVGADTATAPGGGSARARLAAGLDPALAARVEFVGAVPREALPGLYRRASLCVYPARWENCPYTCLEAMACGVPVVGSLRGGMAELIEDGRSGLLVDPGDAEGVAEAICRLLAQPAFARNLGRRGRERVARLCGADAIAERTAALYMDAIAQAGGEGVK